MMTSPDSPDPPAPRLELVATFTHGGEVLLLYRELGGDWRQRPAPADVAEVLRRLRQTISDEPEIVIEPPAIALQEALYRLQALLTPHPYPDLLDPAPP